MRAATFLTILLALSGVTATPVRVTESTRFLVTVVRTLTDQEPAQLSVHVSVSVPPAPASRPRVSVPVPPRTRGLPHQLFQRPPPARI